MSRYVDAALLLTAGAYLLGTSVAMIVRMARRARIDATDNQLSVLPPAVRRWILGEPRQRR
jgi:hypothetical protein